MRMRQRFVQKQYGLRQYVPARYGASDRPPCSQCLAEMFVSRRSPAVNPKHELQLLTCTACGCSVSRTVDGAGHTVPKG